MKNLFRAAMFAVAVLATAPAAANAATFINLDPPAPNGTISGAFGNTGIAEGVFSDIINFALPSNGFTGATISSILTSTTNNVSFTSVFLNGTAFQVGSTGDVEFRFLPAIVTLTGMQTLTINGVSGGEGSYGGAIAFSPAAVPEPATWAMMILGFGMVGVGLRLARRPQAVSLAA